MSWHMETVREPKKVTRYEVFSPSLGCYGLTAQSASQEEPKAISQRMSWSVPGAGDQAKGEEDAEEEYARVMSDPSYWVKTKSWANREAKRKACEQGDTGWLVGVSGDGRRAGAVPLGCGCRECENCGQRRAAEIRRTIDRLFDARPSVMLTLGLAQAETDLWASWSLIAKAWRRCWERLCRLRPSWFLEPCGPGQVEEEMRAAAEKLSHGAAAFTVNTATAPAIGCGYPFGEAGSGPVSLLPRTEAPALKQPKVRVTRVPMAWVLEPHENGRPHMHVGLAVERLGPEGSREGYDLLDEQWREACDYVGLVGAGGWVWISAGTGQKRSPGHYLAGYATKSKHVVPEAVQAYLWGEQRRMFGSSGQPRKAVTREQEAERLERSDWIWELYGKVGAESAYTRALRRLREAVGAGAEVEPWSCLREPERTPTVRCIVTGGLAVYARESWNRETGEPCYVVEWTEPIGEDLSL